VRSQLEDWISSRGAVDLLGTATAAAAPQLDPVVEAALESLTHWVNLGTGLVAPEDKAAAVTDLQTLHRAGYHINPDEVMAWAMRNGWSNRGANELRDVARRVLEGRAFRIMKGLYKPGPELIAYWKEQAAKKKPTK
jgi:hypothetical protein